MIDDEQSPAGWSTRLVERVRLQSYVITFCLQAASEAPSPVVRPKALLNVKVHVNFAATRRECANNEGGSLTFSLADSSEARRRRLMFDYFDLDQESPLSKDLKTRHAR